jgi:predicted lipoprotein with Yx(FWY)xxD motif
MSLKLFRSSQFFALVPFLILLLIASVFVSAQSAKSTVSATTTSGVPTLVGPDGRTLYLLTKDDEGKSTCYDACAKIWPPLVVDGNTQPTAADGAPGKLGMTTRTDGSR